MSLELTSNVHFFCTTFMTGIIWLVHFVHYPSFTYITKSEYTDFQLFHMSRITFIVMPVMLLELFSLLILSYNNMSMGHIFCLIILSLIWANTFFWTVPLHNKLVKNKDSDIIKKLINSNWPRTILWTIKAIFLTVSL